MVILNLQMKLSLEYFFLRKQARLDLLSDVTINVRCGLSSICSKQRLEACCYWLIYPQLFLLRFHALMPLAVSRGFKPRVNDAASHRLPWHLQPQWWSPFTTSFSSLNILLPSRSFMSLWHSHVYFLPFACSKYASDDNVQLGMMGLGVLRERLFRTKKLPSGNLDTQLRRCLSTLDITLLGIGHMIGAGIYVLTGEIGN